ncbi:unnamed protein product [Acanthoscelides obtectus]|uniref:Uncharacterized protein n=1 Tax=Acanthoscelides obtectus TaxID=200917 RepID=A0A9P0LE27_ACAOB|nr:unnamed protein product [Acanthoscelides obtectus]CAK1637969.1 hypothetical protein AOBTE_LOCUS10321 [Acanthoscelides obtectus]
MYRTQPMHTNLQKNSPFREMMNFCMFKLMENGNMDRLRKYWDARKPICIQAAKKKEIHVNLKEFSCGLIALCYGVCFSLVFMLIELVMYSHVWIAIKHMFRGTFGYLYPYTD